ncbi:MAG: S8 family serine peptidase [Crocinitomicaceae bacterium]
MLTNLHSKFAFILLSIAVFNFSGIAQKNTPLHFKSGLVESNIDLAKSKTTFQSVKNGDHYCIIQFHSIPTEDKKSQLKAEGIQLLNYLPKNAFYAKVSSGASWSTIQEVGISQILEIKADYKLSKDLKANKINDWAKVGNNKIALNAVFFNVINKDQARQALTSVSADIQLINDANIANIIIDLSNLPLLFDLPGFYYFEQIDPPSEPENLVGVTNHRSNTLATSYTTGLNFSGEGVTIMLQDNSRLDEHIDYTGRFINNVNASNNGDHGEHCGGTIAGAGNLDPTARGMAFGAEVLVYNPNDNNFNSVPNLVANSNLTITSKSYSGGLNAGYTSLSSQLDQQIRQNPELIHVFSAGNSNGSGSTAAGSQWFNITGGHKAAKNVLAVGNLTLIDILSNSSSRGPSGDGRIKPDICAVGSNVYSTIDPNTYGNKTGTSMACPAIAGVLAQLYEAYKTLNGGINPESALMKATLLNTADDLGNPGPDFKFGFGRVNARRAYDVMSNNQYFSDNISQGDNLSHSITVPSGVAQVKIMVHWSDFEGTASSNQPLVNDINMQVLSPAGAVSNPWVLDNTPNSALLNALPVQAVDDINNVEQITIDNPATGVYTVNLEGFAIPSGPQKYYVVYEFITDDVVLTYPIGGEGIDSDENEFIRWDAYGNSSPFTLEYSIDNGTVWNPIASNVSASVRQFSWNVPAVVTSQALVRVTRGNSTSQSHVGFSIIQVPTNLQVLEVCPDSVTLSWNAVTNATGYEVSMLGNKYMDSVGTSSTNTITLAHSASSDFWWSVKALGANNCIGRRAIAQYSSAGVMNCTLDTDVMVVDSDGLNGNTILTCMETEVLEIGMTIENNGNQPISNIPVSYKLNNSATVNETYAPTIPSGGSVYYTFSNQVAIPFGANTLTIWSQYTGDQNSGNDTIISNFSYLNSAAESLPWSEDFETFSLCGTSSNCEVEICNLSNNFINAKNGTVDDINWRTHEGSTPSIGTGPSADYNPGTTVGNYLYLEPSSTPVCAEKEAHLISPCIDLPDGGLLSFAYNLNGIDMGELHVDILSNGVWTNDVLNPLVGNKGATWKVKTVNLNSFAGNVINIRFRGITGDDYRSDMAIDDINVSSSLGLETNNSSAFSIYPNPSNGMLFYKLDNETNSEIRILDTNGKLIYETVNSTSNGTIDMNSYSKGIYFVHVIMDNETTVQKIVLQ